MPSSYLNFTTPTKAVSAPTTPKATTTTRIPINQYRYTVAEHPGMYFLTDAGANAEAELRMLNEAAAGGWKSPWAADSPFAALTPQWLDTNQKRKAELEKLLNQTEPASVAPSANAVISPTAYFKPPVVPPPLPKEETNTGSQLFPDQFGNSPKGTPAGNNIASGAVAPPNPGSAMSGNQLSTTAPNTGTDINQSPFSPTAGTRKRTSPNKYFNQRWFGTKEIA